MKILYGVVGEGFGHATRSKVILDHLDDKHEVMIVASGKAYEYLSKTYSEIKQIEGFELAFDEEGVSRRGSVKKFLKGLPKKLSKNALAFAKATLDYSPDVVISDFESFAHIMGFTKNIPIISIDNMQVLSRCKLEVEIPIDTIDDYLLARSVVKNKLHRCDHYMITSFFYPEVTKKNTSMYPPILRPEILRAETKWGDHILVYYSGGDNEELLDALERTGEKVFVYGFGEREPRGGLEFKGFSEEGFVRDLATSKAVIGSGGFSLISEAVYLGKPYLAIPLENQFEQFLNALYVRKLRYGEYTRHPNSEDLGHFLDNLDFYENNLQKHKQEGNHQILWDLDKLLEKIEKDG